MSPPPVQQLIDDASAASCVPCRSQIGFVRTFNADKLTMVPKKPATFHDGSHAMTAGCHPILNQAGTQAGAGCEEGSGARSSGDDGGTGTGQPWDGSGTEVHRIPNCMQSALGRNEDVLCGGAVMGCPPGKIRYRNYTRPTLFGNPDDRCGHRARCHGRHRPADNPACARDADPGRLGRLTPVSGPCPCQGALSC